MTPMPTASSQNTTLEVIAPNKFVSPLLGEGRDRRERKMHLACRFQLRQAMHWPQKPFPVYA